MKKIAIAVVVVALVGIALIALPTIMGFGQMGRLGITLYDADGNEIFMPAFARGNIEVLDKFTVTLSYTVTASKDVTGLAVTGSVTVSAYSLKYWPDTSSPLRTETHTISETVLTKNYSWDHTYSALCLLTAKEYGWMIVVTGTLHAAGNVGGEDYTADWTDSVEFKITWIEETFTLSGNVAG